MKAENLVLHVCVFWRTFCFIVVKLKHEYQTIEDGRRHKQTRTLLNGKGGARGVAWSSGRSRWCGMTEWEVSGAWYGRMGGANAMCGWVGGDSTSSSSQRLSATWSSTSGFLFNVQRIPGVPRGSNHGTAAFPLFLFDLLLFKYSDTENPP